MGRRGGMERKRGERNGREEEGRQGGGIKRRETKGREREGRGGKEVTEF